MKCDICRTRPAVMFVQQVSKGSTIELHLCDVCAKERGFTQQNGHSDLSLSNLFSNILNKKDAQINTGQDVCPDCCFSFSDIKKFRKAGCSSCYSFFRTEIISLLRGEGIEISYTGPLPEKTKKVYTRHNNPNNLKKELAKAIQQEDYEMAAYFRDRLKSLGVEP
ncbi:UvrB/UvrC motif-containing protein [Brucepastera parasyntrophica]|uniref:UvrB/UvrC motif-containing protein n=1 Tax=Brucepastera parasyntrophica TaxID=2880008 RepID=UPI00210B14C9|nr:UvrB/UvrC motif-containing protein [Brucepastera parasyntrophica]ULQ59938.1 UvrB/UvrC motif-containing protein [Brucepastera parasyntrophica]